MRAFELCVAGYLFNALWQVPLLTAAGLLLARFNAAVRDKYNYWLVVLALEVLMPAVPLLPIPLTRNRVSILDWLRHLLQTTGAADGHVQVRVGSGVARGAGDFLLSAPVLHAVALGYGLIVLIAVCRLGLGLVRAVRMTRTAEVLSQPAEGWPRLRIASSTQVNGPCVVGFLRPVLLVPKGFLGSLDDEERRALLAHEEAHAVRFDFVTNLLYSILTLPICFHPAAWFTRARLAEAREMVCDEMAAARLAAAGAGPAYARSLIRLASVLATARPALPLHAIAFCDANTLERRVAMLIRKQTKWGGWRRAAAVCACGLVLVAANASALALRVHVGAQEGGGAPMAVSAGVMAGNAVTKVPPVYPQEAKADPLNGPVILDAIIGKDGSVESLRIKQSLREDYDRSAMEAVRQWKYKPFLLNGQPTEVETTITVNYMMGG